MSGPQQIFHNTAHAMAADLAGSIARDLTKSEKPFLILPGGSSPRELMGELARKSIDWGRVTVSTTDERCVPLDSKDSNAGQIKRLLGVAPFWLTPEADTGELPWPASVTVLGMGMDAHIASLFPGETLNLKAEGLVNVQAPVPPHERVSLTLKTLMDTKRLILLVTGAEKWALCERILQGDQQDTPLAVLIKQAGGKLALHIVKG